jgi:hypothetical protein
VVVPRRLLAVAAAALASAVIAAPANASAASRSTAAYSGLGAWVSIYDLAAWQNPERTVAKLVAHRVHTLFLETANYRQPVDVVRPAIAVRFIAAAHAAGLDIVGWYLPSLENPARDLRRTLAGIALATPDGEQFDSFALDVESTVVRSFALRNSRAVALASQLRGVLPEDYPLGAITIAPVGASPTYWPSFPFRSLSRIVDVLLPMEYFSARTKGAAGVRTYSAANLRVIRAQVGSQFPIHPIGGVAARARPAEVRAFVQATLACRTIGASLWELNETTAAQWVQLAPLATTAPPATGTAPLPADVC